MASYLVFGAIYAFAAAAQPGPLQAYLVSESLRQGWRRTLPAAFAPLLSDAPIIALTLLGLSRLSADALWLLRLAGGLFLLYLAYRAFRTWRVYDPAAATTDLPQHNTLLRAALVNVLNPNPWLGWSLVMGPLFLKGYREHPSHGIALIAGFYATMIVCLTGFIAIFAFARQLGPRVNRIALGLSVLALAGFGFYQLWLGARSGLS